MINVLILIGTRPEAIKMVPVIDEINKNRDQLNLTLVVTGQHKEMMLQSLEPFGLKPDIDLDIMKPNQTLTYITTETMNRLERVVEDKKPDVIVVHGDTQAAFAGSLIGFFHKIPVAHVEAGLRTDNKYSPFPEEINRRLVDVLADFYFAPTEMSIENLLRENVEEKNIYLTGQTSVDLALKTSLEDYEFSNKEYNRILNFDGIVVTMTAHRRENQGDIMKDMFQHILKIVEENPNILLVYPCHLNPKVRIPANEILGNHDRIILTDPCSYHDMIKLIVNSYLAISDSGGLQEECTTLKTPLVLMRDTTERPEAIKANTVILAGNKGAEIKKVVEDLLNDEKKYNAMKENENPFGDGKASERIVKLLLEKLS